MELHPELKAAMTNITIVRNTMAPSVSANALPRLATTLFGSSCSRATWMPVTSAGMTD